MPPLRKLPGHLETDPRRMLERLVGLPEVTVLGLSSTDERFELHIESIAERPGCPVCGVVATPKGWREVVLVDLQFGGKPMALHWHKRRWRCADEDCPNGSWTECEDRIAHPRMKLTRRAALRATEDVGRRGRTVNEVAIELGCDWHTVNDAVVAYGGALLEHPGRFETVNALGLDETAFLRCAPYYRTEFVTSIVDVERGQLLDLVPGRGGEAPRNWLMAQGQQWRDAVEFATLDLSGAYKAVLDACVPDATQVADPFHVVKVRHEAPCNRGRVRGPRPNGLSQQSGEAEGSLTEEMLGRAGSSPDNDGTGWHCQTTWCPASETERCNESEPAV